MQLPSLMLDTFDDNLERPVLVCRAMPTMYPDVPRPRPARARWRRSPPRPRRQKVLGLALN
ncbi:MAG: hypothetical protein N838_26605 [Thiohalocapsa sp. PB-PSB1]|jgi:hypothetical protein|nr:MAG: hypothetical protein N838_26605 [Thiohalocapsa sp. PB-PSB1]